MMFTRRLSEWGPSRATPFLTPFPIRCDSDHNLRNAGVEASS